MDNLAADFIIEFNNPIEAEFELSEGPQFDAVFIINAVPSKVSQLENDLNFQTGEQVEISINEATATINERIDEVVETFDEEISNINERMIDTIEGDDLIGVSRNENTITLNSQTFVFEQGIASKEWNIIHNLNKRPSIELVDSSGRVFEAVKDYISDNQVIIRLDAATSGYAYLN